MGARWFLEASRNVECDGKAGGHEVAWSVRLRGGCMVVRVDAM